ncbi:MAG: hypothetical protein KDB23_02465 [Planctomycetales bacterium]|nr:hypothetical protein [Planctomycetales bacterium]
MARFSDEIRLATTVTGTPDRPAGSWVTVNRERMKKGPLYVRGRQGEGKSATVLLPLAIERMRPYTIYDRSSSGVSTIVEENCRDAQLIIDPGGDLGLYNGLKYAAKKNQRPFYWLSIDPKHDTYHINIVKRMADTDIRWATGIVTALGLDYGLGYGKLHYSLRPYDALLPVAEKLFKTNGEATIDDVIRQLKLQSGRDIEDICTLFEILSCYPQLYPASDPDRNMDLFDAIEKRAVIYVHAPTEDESIPARCIIGLIIECFKSAAAERYRRGMPKVHCWVSIDEFHEVVGRSLAATIAQCRKRGISLDLLHQFSGQLISRDIDLRPIVRESSVVKVYFSFSADDIDDEILAFSKDDHIWRRTVGELGDGSVHEHVEPLAKKDVVLDVHGTHRQCLVSIDDGCGFREAYRAQTQYVFDEATYDMFASTPIPMCLASTPEVTIHPMTEVRAQRMQVVKSILDKRRAVLDPFGFAGKGQ